MKPNDPRPTVAPTRSVALAAAPTRVGADRSSAPTAGRLNAGLRVPLAMLLTLLVMLFAAVPAHAADDYLEPDLAFQTRLVSADAHEIVLAATAADGYHLYRSRFAVSSPEAGVQLGAPELPAGKREFDAQLGHEVETYHGEVRIRVPIVSAPAQFPVALDLQGCADAGLCYSPMRKEFPVKLAAAVVGSPAAVAAAAPARAQAPAAPTRVATAGAGGGGELDRIRNTLASGSLTTITSAFFVLGLLLAFTPCVLPMVPILSSIIVGQSQSQPATRSRNFGLALAYSLGMALVYTALGVAAGLAGEGLAAMLQKPWVLATFAALLIGLALSMFDLYHFEMPHFVQGRANSLANRLPGGRFVGVFAMGAVSALIVGPCVAAPLAGALVYISQTRNVVIGGAALFAMAMGMSVPLLAIGASAGSLIPRAGAWMVAVKRFFGALLIGVAIWMVSPVLPEWAQMLAWATLLVISATYLSVFDPLPAEAGGWQRLWKGVGVMMLALGAVQIVGVASGGRSVLQPLEALAARGGGATQLAEAGPQFETVASLADLERRIKSAGRPALVDFSADWCVSCKEMESITFADPRVRARMKQLVLLRVDVTENNGRDRELLKRFGLFGPPGILLFGPDGREIERERVVGFVPPDRFLQHLSQARGADL